MRRHALRRMVLAGLCLAPGSACRRTAADPTRAGARGGASVAPEQAAADTLGRELFVLLDRMTIYQGAHQGRPAAHVAALGLDSLGPAVVRRIAAGATPTAEVAYRRPGGRPVRACRATAQVLEDVALEGGRFTIHCTMADGGDRPFTILPSAPPASVR